MLQRMDHFSSMVAFEMRPRQKCQISQDPPPEISAETWSIQLSPKMAQFGIQSRLKIARISGKSGSQEET